MARIRPNLLPEIVGAIAPRRIGEAATREFLWRMAEEVTRRYAASGRKDLVKSYFTLTVPDGHPLYVAWANVRRESRIALENVVSNELRMEYDRGSGPPCALGVGNGASRRAPERERAPLGD